MKKDILLTAAAAKLLQSCPTLCDPVDGSLPGSSVYGTLQARTLPGGLPFPSPGGLPDPGVEPMSLASLARAGRFYSTWKTPDALVAFSVLVLCRTVPDNLEHPCGELANLQDTAGFPAYWDSVPPKCPR